MLTPLGSSPTSVATTALRTALARSSNSPGGWGYYAGKASRIEPTAWGLLALSAAGDLGPAATHAAFLQRLQQPSGWLVEGANQPVNIGFNALTAFAWASEPTLASDGARAKLFGALVGSKGIRVKTVDPNGQDNSLQGWSWIDGTFSWVEPTAWGLLALKRARRADLNVDGAAARIDEAERLLINRMCRTGGWNFGNAAAMNQDLRAYVPTTALALLAMQDRNTENAVAKSVAFLETHWSEEVSAPAMGLSLLALAAFGRPTAAIEAQLAAHVTKAIEFGNLHGNAVALAALSAATGSHVFTL